MTDLSVDTLLDQQNAIKSKVGYILSDSFCNSVLYNSAVFACHTLKCSSEIVTDILDKTVENFGVLRKLELKKQTIPKLELMSTLLLSRLMTRIKVDLSFCFNLCSSLLLIQFRGSTPLKLWCWKVLWFICSLSCC